MNLQHAHWGELPLPAGLATLLNGFIPVFADVVDLRAVSCVGVTDNSLAWMQKGDLTLLYQKQTGADAEALPGTIRSDSHATTSCIYYLKAECRDATAHCQVIQRSWRAGRVGNKQWRRWRRGSVPRWNTG